MLKHKWSLFHTEEEEWPKWLETIAHKDTPREGWAEIDGKPWHGATLHTLAKLCEQTHKAKQARESLQVAFVNKIRQLRQRQADERPEFSARHTERNGKKIQTLTRKQKRIAPGWLMTALGQIGIHKEVHADPLAVSPELDDHGIATGSGWDMSTDNTLTAGTLRNMLDHTNEQVREWCEAVQREFHTMQHATHAARHILLIESDEASQSAREHGGHIWARWPAKDFNSLTYAWLETNSQTTLRNEHPVYLVAWETEGLEDTWGVPDTFWQEIIGGGEKAGSHIPEIEGSWGRTRAVQNCVQQKAKEGHNAAHANLARQQVLKQQWAELQTQEQRNPELFWASQVHVPKPKGTNADATSPQDTETALVQVHVAGTSIERRVRLQPDKKPGNEQLRQNRKEQQKAHRKECIKQRDQIEADIFENRRSIQRLHSFLQRQKLRNAALAKGADKKCPTVTQWAHSPRLGYAALPDQPQVVDKENLKRRRDRRQTTIARTLTNRAPPEVQVNELCSIHGDPNVYEANQAKRRKLEKYRYFPPHLRKQGKLQYLDLFKHQPCAMCEQIKQKRQPAHNGIT